jgi:hypothetical protein
MPAQGCKPHAVNSLPSTTRDVHAPGVLTGRVADYASSSSAVIRRWQARDSGQQLVPGAGGSSPTDS